MFYIAALFIIGLLILAHEFGHFIAARSVGIPVSVFSIGFGPKLFSFQRNETEYRVSLVPLGGYVMPGIDSEEEYFRYPVYRRIILSLGGPAANLLLAILLFSIISVLRGDISLNSLIIKPVTHTFALFGTMLVSLGQVFSGSQSLSGIVGIVKAGGTLIEAGLARALGFAAFLSVNLALINLLPIPALDGGKIVLHLMEKINFRFTKVFAPLSIAGWVFILGLMIYVTILDISRMI